MGCVASAPGETVRLRSETVAPGGERRPGALRHDTTMRPWVTALSSHGRRRVRVPNEHLRGCIHCQLETIGQV